MRPNSKPKPKPKPNSKPTLKVSEESYYTQPDRPKQKYDLAKHNEQFDPWQHGYIWKRGYMWYRRPDGVDVRAYSGINTFDEFGDLIPVG